jgi:endonuclease YncB( thermonuclease family)
MRRGRAEVTTRLTPAALALLVGSALLVRACRPAAPGDAAPPGEGAGRIALASGAAAGQALPAPAPSEAAASAPCPVARVFDGDTVAVLLDGREVTVRLVGVDAPETGGHDRPVEPYGAEASAFLDGLLRGHAVRLEGEPGQAPLDAYGRTLAYLRRDPDGLFVNLELVRQGYARAYTRFPSRYRDLFLAAEGEAREAGRGLWASAARGDVPGAGRALGPEEAAAHAGEDATVCGKVARASWMRSVKGEPTFVDFERPHPDQPFKAVLWGRDRAGFGEPEKEWPGRTLCVTGRIEIHKGKPEIVLRDPGQVEVRP